MQYDKDDRIERQDFLQEFGFQASTENRARKQRLPWPPWVICGARIYYSRQSVQRWFDEQEAKAADTAVHDQARQEDTGSETRRKRNEFAGVHPGSDCVLDAMGGETP